MRQTDIIVVAPYNAQVNALGTVDKFQGQEAPVCLVSMTTSSADETSGGMEFLFSLNRINVAVSRAKGLALVFGAPRRREAKYEIVEQMRLVNTLCAVPQFDHNDQGPVTEVGHPPAFSRAIHAYLCLSQKPTPATTQSRTDECSPSSPAH